MLRDHADWQDTLTYIAGMHGSLSRLPAVIEQRCLAAEIAQEGAVLWKLATIIKDFEVSVGQQTNPEVKQGLETVLGSLKALL